MATKKTKKVEPEVQQPSTATETTSVVVILGCNDVELSGKMVELAKNANAKILALPDNVVNDYLKSLTAEHPKEVDEVQRTKAFISDERNRKEATDKAVKLFTILRPKEDLSKANEIVFSEDEVCRNTTLSHSKARQLFNLFSAFGLIEFVDKLHFRLIFNKAKQHEFIMRGIRSMIYALQIDIARFNNSIKNDDGLSDEERKKYDEMLRKATQPIVRDLVPENGEKATKADAPAPKPTTVKRSRKTATNK